MMKMMNKKTQDVENSIVLDYSKIVDGVEMKGVVSYNGKSFFKGLPTPVEMTLSEARQQNFMIDPSFKIYESHEGTLIRVFNIDGKWFVSTNRKLNASNSKWAARHETFGQYFTLAIREILQEFDLKDVSENELPYKEQIDVLNQKNSHFLEQVFDRNLSGSNKYLFLLKPSQEEKVVCRVCNVPTVYHVGTFDSEDNEIFDDLLFDGKKIDRPTQRNFQTLHDLESAMNELDIYSLQGFLIIGEKTTYKILHDEYKKLFDIRGNIPSLRFRYLQLRRYSCDKDLSLTDLEEFIRLYNFEADETDIELEIFSLCEDLHEKYMGVFVFHDKDLSSLNKSEQNFLSKTVHKAYIESNRRVNTTPSRINDLLTRVDPPVLNKLLTEKRMRNTAKNN
ncbi:MAG: hypothetical protein ACRDAQ_10820 [Cetobacterium sp.]